MNKRAGYPVMFLMALFIFLTSSLGQTEVRVMAQGGSMENEPDAILRRQDGGKEINLKAGQVLQVQLEAMGGTGYWWYVQNLDGRRVELLSEKTKVGSEGQLGGLVLGLWTFRTKEPGTAEIKMDYYRSWEGNARAIDHFRMKITIE